MVKEMRDLVCEGEHLRNECPECIVECTSTEAELIIGHFGKKGLREDNIRAANLLGESRQGGNSCKDMMLELFVESIKVILREPPFFGPRISDSSLPQEGHIVEKNEMGAFEQEVQDLFLDPLYELIRKFWFQGSAVAHGDSPYVQVSGRTLA